MTVETFKRYMVRDSTGIWRLPAYVMEESAKQDAEGKVGQHWEAWEVEVRLLKRIWPEVPEAK